MKKNIIRDYKLKLSYKKKDIKKNIIKSIMHNADNTILLKRYLKYKIVMWKKKYKISFQKRVCLILGKNRGVYPKINLKRHTIKKVNETTLITGLSMAKW